MSDSEDVTVLSDVQKMIEALKQDKKYSPLIMYYADSTIRAMGYDPNDYPELEGYPGVRVITGSYHD